jgi:1-acyl-sn-glycerol-3-phosphate acyltransferase
MNILFSCLYWIFLGSTAIILYLVAVVLWALTSWYDNTGSLLHRYTCWWAVLYLRCLPGCRLHVEGRDKIAPRTAYVLAANHQSMTDIMALSALAVPFKWVSKKEAFRLPFIGWNMYLNRYVCVDRGSIRNVARTMRICRYWLKRGLPLMMFPEGHRSADGSLLKFHGGAFKLAADCECPVLPIVVDGTLPIYRGWRVLAFPGRITIRVLDPVTAAEVGGADRLRDEVFQRMQKTLVHIRSPQSPPRPVPTAG